jgi:predicted nucleic acid-binding protein
LTWSSKVERVLRRLKPHKRAKPLARRSDEILPFARPDARPARQVVLDTTVYIDQMQRRFPGDLGVLLRRCGLWHSSVAIAELTVGLGRLDPRHPATPSAVRQIQAVIAKIPAHRILNPTVAIWREAAIAAGLLERLQGFAASRTHDLLNDALIFFDARKHGRTVLTRNIADFDLLQQLAPDGQVLFYRI